MPKRYFWIGARVDEICHIVPNSADNKDNFPTSIYFKNGRSINIGLDFKTAQKQLEAILQENESTETIELKAMRSSVQELTDERDALKIEVDQLKVLRETIKEGYNGSAHARFLQWHNESRQYMRSDERQAILKAFEIIEKEATK